MSVISFDNTKYGNAHEIVQKISECVPSHVQVDVLRETFPNGVVRGSVFYIGSLAGERGESLKIDINPSSPHFMKGQDFNGGTGVGGIVKILMEARGMRLPEIKKMFEQYIPEDRRPTVKAPDWAKPKPTINLNDVPYDDFVQQPPSGS